MLTQNYDAEILQQSGKDGEGILESGVRFQIHTVYFTANPTIPLEDRQHHFSFQEYVTLGRPTQLKIIKTFEYQPEEHLEKEE